MQYISLSHLHEAEVAGALLIICNAANGDVCAAGAVVVHKLHVVHAVPAGAAQPHPELKGQLLLVFTAAQETAAVTTCNVQLRGSYVFVLFRVFSV